MRRWPSLLPVGGCPPDSSVIRTTRIPSRIISESLLCRFDHHVIGKDLECAHLPPGWGINADEQSTNTRRRGAWNVCSTFKIQLQELYYSSRHYPHGTHFSNFIGFLSNGGYSLRGLIALSDLSSAFDSFYWMIMALNQISLLTYLLTYTEIHSAWRKADNHTLWQRNYHRHGKINMHN